MEGGKILMRWKFRGMKGEAGEEDVEEKRWESGVGAMKRIWESKNIKIILEGRAICYCRR
jgi:hypothetical protein